MNEKSEPAEKISGALAFLLLLFEIVSIRAVFSKVWLYFVGTQKILIACDHDCEPSLETIRSIDLNRRLRPIVVIFGGASRNLLQYRLLDPARIDRFIQSFSIPSSDLISTDDNLYLEYHTPKGNVREFRSSLLENLVFIEPFTPPSYLDGTRLDASMLPGWRDRKSD